MAQRNRFLYGTFAIAGLVMVLAQGCGDDGGGGDDDLSLGGEGGEPGTSGAPSGGKAGSSSGGRAGSPQQVGGAPGAAGETGEAGNDGEGGTGEGGAGGNVPTTADVDDVVAAVCDWEFRCCDEGELTYRLSPFADDAADCTRRLVYEMRESNGTDNPYKSGPAAEGGLLGVLGYAVDLSRVTVNPRGAAACVAAWNARECNSAPEPGLRCSGPGESDPCALTNLFEPKLGLGAECSIALAETGAANDVECVAGSTCLAADHPDNPKDIPICVKRGLAEDPCTDDDDCDFDFYCNDGDCAPKGDVGEECSFSDPDAPAAGEEEQKCKAGLSCHPVDFVCVAPCSLDATCVADAQCPEGSGCAPVETGEGEPQFKVCTRLGTTAAALCDTDEDCTEANHCDGTKCQADRAAQATCTAQNQCATGLHCDVGGTGTCISNLAAGATCTQSYQCAPDSAGCVSISPTAKACKRTLLSNGEACGDNAACGSGRCEYANPSATNATCIAGAKLNAPCDSLPTDGEATSCGPGLLCQGTNIASAGGGTCVAQSDPGLSCEDENGMAVNGLCKNGSMCTDAWNEGNVCSDAAVPKANGGTGIACDGE